MRLPAWARCVLCAAVAAGWLETHERDPSVLRVAVERGDSYVDAVRRLAARCDMHHMEGVLAETFRQRYRFTVADELAPYRMEIVVSLDGCHRQAVSMATDDWTHSFGTLVYDERDDVAALAADECACISAPGADTAGCAAAVAAAMRASLANASPSPCSPGCAAAFERRRAAAADAALDAAIASAAALRDHAFYVAGAKMTADALAAAAVGRAPPPDLREAPATALGRCGSPVRGGPPTTCVLRDAYVMNGEWYVVHEDGVAVDGDGTLRGEALEMPALALSCDPDAPSFAPRRLSRSALRDLTSTLGVPVRDASVAKGFLYERFGDDSLHPGHALTFYALPAFWAQGLVGLEGARLMLNDGAPAYDNDRWLAAAFDDPPLYRDRFESRLCARGVLCRVRELAVGAATLDWNQWRHAPVLFGAVHRRFAKAARERLKLPAADGPRARRAVLVQRLHSRVIPGAAALAGAVGADVFVLDHEPAAAQLALLDDARVVVAVDGGALDLALLARPASGYVTIKRPWDTESPDGCRGCPTGGPDGQCCDWHRELFAAANDTWLCAESIDPGPGLAVDAATLGAAIARVETRLAALADYRGGASSGAGRGS